LGGNNYLQKGIHFIKNTASKDSGATRQMVTDRCKLPIENVEPIRIVHIISGDLWAGAEAQVFSTLSCLSRIKGNDLLCILFNSGILKEKLDTINIKTVVLDESLANNLFLLWNLHKTINTVKPHIIHVHRVKEHLLSTAASFTMRRKIPIVRTVHGSRAASRRLPLNQYLKSSLAVTLDNLLIKYFSSAIIAVSKDLEKEFIQLKVRGKIYQIYNSIDTENPAPAITKEEIRRQYRVNGLFWIGTAARLVEVKNLPMLIEAATYLTESKIPFKISIFGDGPLKTELLDLIARSNLAGKVELQGFVQDIRPIINSLDVFVLSSQHEGTPMALLEAILLKTPVICTSVGGMKDSKGLADRIMKCYEGRDEAVKITENARKVLEDKYSLIKATKSLYNVYRELINENGGV
jgi:glycosyltransferase involved in cell wall biosynthesis